MNNSPYDKIYDLFKEYATSNSEYRPIILKKPAGEIFPKIIIQKISDISTTLVDPHSLIGIEFDIYTKDKEVDGELKDSMEIAIELESMVKVFMSNLRFKRILDTPTPNIDGTVYRITMQFIANVSDTRCCFF